LRVDVVAAADVRQDHSKLVAAHPRNRIRALSRHAARIEASGDGVAVSTN
jgi:hypothetical protein